MLPKLHEFYMKCMLPELVDPRKRRSMPLREPDFVISAQERKQARDAEAAAAAEQRRVARAAAAEKRSTRGVGARRGRGRRGARGGVHADARGDPTGGTAGSEGDVLHERAYLMLESIETSDTADSESAWVEIDDNVGVSTANHGDGSVDQDTALNMCTDKHFVPGEIIDLQEITLHQSAPPTTSYDDMAALVYNVDSLSTSENFEISGESEMSLCDALKFSVML